MKKLFLAYLLLASSVCASAQSERATRLQNARNLVVTTTDGNVSYHATSTAQSLIMRKQGNTLTFSGQTMNMSDIQKMRLVVPQKFALNEDSTTFTPYAVDHGLLALRYDFQLNKWNPMTLPVSMSGRQVLDAFGEGTLLARYSGATEGEWAQIDFELIDLNTDEVVINAGTHYIVKPTREPDIPKGRKTTLSYGSAQVSGPAYIIYNVSMEGGKAIPGNQSLQSETRKVRMRASGTYTKMTDNHKLSYINRPFYCMDNDGHFFESNDSVEMKAFRNWVVFVANSDSVPMRFYINGIDEDLTLTGIDHATLRGENGTDDESVYDLSGRRLGSRQMLDGRLSRGIYIVNGKKIMVR